jgi:hypothetical protein
MRFGIAEVGQWRPWARRFPITRLNLLPWWIIIINRFYLFQLFNCLQFLRVQRIIFFTILGPFWIFTNTVGSDCNSGPRNWNRENRSISSAFWIGVPLRIHRQKASSLKIASAVSVLWFQILWPSSKTIRSNFNCKKTDELVTALPCSEFASENISHRTMFIGRNKYRQIL